MLRYVLSSNARLKLSSSLCQSDELEDVEVDDTPAPPPAQTRPSVSATSLPAPMPFTVPMPLQHNNFPYMAPIGPPVMYPVARTYWFVNETPVVSSRDKRPPQHRHDSTPGWLRGKSELLNLL